MLSFNMIRYDKIKGVTFYELGMPADENALTNGVDDVKNTFL